MLRADLRLVAQAIEISRRTDARMRQNLLCAFVHNAVGIALVGFGLLTTVGAGAAMALSSLSVIGNALPLRHSAPLRP